MPAEVIDGRKIAAEIQGELKQRIGRLQQRGVAPKLVTVLVGEDPASLSYLRGIARALEKHKDCGGMEFAQALALASATAYKGVIKPVEGTMLTVGRDCAQAAQAAADRAKEMGDELGMG